MYFIRKLIAVSLLFFPATLWAEAGAPGHSHSDGHAHQHEITQEQAKTNALDIVTKLIKKGKIDNSWESVKPASSEKKTTTAGKEWVVTFTNTSVKDINKQTLYVFLSETGQYVAANFTGK